MSFTERISMLINELRAKGVKKYEVAVTAGYSKGIVVQWENGTSKSISPEGAINLEKAYGYNHKWLLFGELPKMVGNEKEIIPDERWESVPLVNINLKAGISGYAVDYLDEKEYEPLFFKKTWFIKRGYNPQKLIALLVKGNSMQPVLEDGSVVVINTENTVPKDREIFAVNYHGEAVVKRLVYDFGGFWLVSDNPDQRLYPRIKCDENTIIIGKVVHYQTEL